MISDDSAKRTDAPGPRVLHRPARLVDGNLCIDDTAGRDARAACYRWKNVDPVAVSQLFRSAREFVVDGESHSRKEVLKSWKACGYGAAKLRLFHSLSFELERRAFAPGEIPSAGIVRDNDPHEDPG